VTNPDGERATFLFTFSWQGGDDVPIVAPIDGVNDDFGNGDYGGRSGGWSAPAFGGQAAAIRRPAPSRTVVRPSAPPPAQPALGVQSRPTPSVQAPPVPPAATVEHIAALQKQMDDMQTDHKNLFERLETKISGFFERKQK
jgi:hypothetical protein